MHSILIFAIESVKRTLLIILQIYYNWIHDYWPSEFCNNTDIAENANRIQSHTGRIDNTTEKSGDKRGYEIMCSIEHDENNEIIAEEINVHINWGVKSQTPVCSYPEQLLKIVAARLHIGSPSIGGKVTNHSIDHGCTEITFNNNIYRCHPFYVNTGSWYDWAYFRWEGFEYCIPTRLLMVFDLS